MVGRLLLVASVAASVGFGAGCASPLAQGEEDLATAPAWDFALEPPDEGAPADLAVDDMACAGLRCDAGCVDSDNDVANCGGCGVACAKGQACIAGACVCGPASCNGCCMGGFCLAGDGDQACGAGGMACQACQTKCINFGCSGCTPNAVDTQPCGNCGTMTRTCDMNGVWGAFGMCMNQGVCTPMATRKLACGNCGTETQTCSDKCAWLPGQCTGQGVCAPGDARAGNCDPCAQQVCGNNCAWNACTLKKGNACEWRNGTHTRGCMCGNGCGGQSLQWCLQSCQWSNACACCTQAGCVNC